MLLRIDYCEVRRFEGQQFFCVKLLVQWLVKCVFLAFFSMTPGSNVINTQAFIILECQVLFSHK
jgi:hypothetical protein